MATILIVDDYQANRELLVTLLGYGGHRLLEACDGLEALEAVRLHRPDLVLTDVLMPTMDGFEFVRRLRLEPAIAATGVIFCTASYLESEARSLASACGVIHVIPKPCEPEAVLRAVSQALGVDAPMPQPYGIVAPGEDFYREHLRLITDKLSHNTDQLAAANAQLNALLEINLRLSAERDPLLFLENIALRARNLTGAKYAVVGLSQKPDGALARFATAGMDGSAALDLGALREEAAAVPAGILTQRRFNALGEPLKGDFRESQAPVPACLEAVIHASEHRFGYLWLGNKLGAETFTEHDEKLLAMFCEQVGRICENRSLERELRRRSAMLEEEIAERVLGEEKIHQLNAELEDRVAARTAELETANKELESFTYSVSHDLRAPLRAMNGFSSIVLEDSGKELPEKSRRFLELIYKNAVQMGQLVDDLLAFSHLGRQALRLQCVDCDQLVQECLSSLAEEQRDRDVTWHIEPLPRCEADRRLLKQVWLNLLTNALKYTRNRPQTCIEIGSQAQTRVSTYFIRDNGAGFDMRYANKLFGVFQRLHADEDYEGTGVGLAIVQRIVQKHGGCVWAQAEENKGATFFFTLEA